MSKGSRPRPFSISQEEFGNRMDAIFGKKDRRVVEDSQAEDEAFEAIEERNQPKLPNDSEQGSN